MRPVKNNNCAASNFMNYTMLNANVWLGNNYTELANGSRQDR
jgi:hypothetical protein